MSMPRITMLLLLAGLAGCSHLPFSGTSTPKSEPGSPARSCEDAAAADSSLNEYAAQRATSDPRSYGDILGQLRAASIDRCLQQRGLLPKGGVERVRG